MITEAEKKLPSGQSATEGSDWLGVKDSNLHKQIQSLSSCR